MTPCVGVQDIIYLINGLLASFPGFTRALVLRPIRNALAFVAFLIGLSTSVAFVAFLIWSEYERTGKAWERG